MIRIRAVILGLAFAVLICGLTPFNNAYKAATLLGGGHFPMAPFFILIWLTLLVGLGQRLFKTAWLTGPELLSVWMLMALVSGIAYTGLARTFFINLTAPFHFATVGNEWKELFYPLMPASWYPQSTEAVESLYNGLSDGRRMGWIEVLARIPWRAWAVPLLHWSAFVLLCYFVMICIVNLFGRHWVHNERMNMPLLRVPELIEEAAEENRLPGFFTDRFLLAGLAIPVALHLLNGLSVYYPTLPSIPTLILAGPYFPKYGLFSGFHDLKIYIYPAFIGFAFLTPRQISFSFWLFFILGGLLMGLLEVMGYQIPAAALGVTFGPVLSRPEETQMIGAYGVFFLFILWLSRFHLRDIVKQAFGGNRQAPTENEWFPPVWSFWGTVAGTVAIMVWLAAFGMAPLAAFLVVGAFFMMLLVASRVVCQGGMAYFTLTAAPLDGLLSFFGPGLFSHAGIFLAAVVQKVLFVDLRESLMPSLFHASGVSRKARQSRTRFFWAMALTLVAGLAASLVAMLALCYKYGIRDLQLDWASRTTVSVYEKIHTLIQSPPPDSHWVLVFSLAGAMVMLILVVCYHRFYWWPVHPIGYLTAYSSAMWILWFGFFVGWACNTLCIRYGGVGLFRRLRYFFIGLIIGDFLMAGTWAIVGWTSDMSYQVLPD